MDTSIENEIWRIIDANLNRVREGIRVLEDIARYAKSDYPLASRLKSLRHLAKIQSYNLLLHRNIKNDILKESILSEKQRDSLESIIIANFKRAQEASRVLEEIFKLHSKDLDLRFKIDESILDSTTNSTPSELFKHIRYELYDIEIEFCAKFLINK